MIPRARRLLCIALAATAATTAHAAPQAARGFQFSVIGHPLQHGRDEAALKRAIAEAAQSDTAFVVATGIKARNEPCSDKLYAQRHAVLNESLQPMIVSLAGSDWSACINSAGRSNAIERLNRLRELFYVDGESLGAHHLTVTRLSSTAKFRSYAENAHWEYSKVLFATINLPANNNHYLPEAGRNSEFEDRLVANRAWLHRLFTLAERQKMQGLVLFSDGDPGVTAEEGFSLLPSFQNKQDGFAEMRKQIRTLAEKYKGKVLLIDAQKGAGGEPAIQWRGNVGHLNMAADWAEVQVTPGAAALFSVKGSNAEAQ
ncbi:hypothetical protein GTP58_00750 [Duganella sp. CY15W]|uniref:hypothetical protein n=1 Tax=Duganella sp. CY15W TaxID=2692172 RepID=UPI00136DECB5|nr:hypothetical protein [Duganella sp. CY15W]MYM26847.1 hypothetical protein [Duganella sp. CY15W]